MKVGLFADIWTSCTGFSVVTTNLAKQLGKYDDLEVYYFGRFGCEKGWLEPENIYNFMGVKCEGGVWNKETVIQIIRKFDLDIVYSEDDWFSASGLLIACKFWGKPFYFLTPIDSIPVHPEGLFLLRECAKVFVPTRGAQTYLKSKGINSIYLPHACDYQYFKPFKVNNKPDDFTFLWVGRDGERKALGRMLIAYKQLLSQTELKSKLLIRCDWNVPQAQRTLQYINRTPELRNNILYEQMEDNPHQELAKTYNRGDCFICSSKAGGFEMGIIEASASGLPVLVTDHTFMNEQVVNGKSGFLIPIKKHTVSKYGSLWGSISITDLTEKMLYYLEHQDIARNHGIWGSHYVRQAYRWEWSGKQLYNTIKEAK